VGHLALVLVEERIGSPQASIYLGSPEVAAATALMGYITHIRHV
jgi:methanogen homoaconitase large subunit